ncbi:dihydrolipoamide acetyltransferase family protein [Agrococcus casei]|uniref:Dihydrolipoamide acetyltransferase component of pyruvate dehydrogenase complex n=2 Tax=Agrococcus TaxID=46352 RepID=A0A1R4GPE7_9MICO|nr:dihydrolipoamide acetyltransferase family protein [Agrococcus casei]SJM69933.1 Dihydrolipoamide acetyltransferase component of pyruvate dehydrogenase complex [Agrococcus casei LMG 22410]
MTVFKLPDLGEGLTESEIVSWQVAVGDHVELNQTLAEVETAKATVDLPSPFAGIVTKLHAEPGTTVDVGAPIIEFQLEGEAAADEPEAAPAAEAPTAAPAAAEAPVEDAPVEDERIETLVGAVTISKNRPKRSKRSYEVSAYEREERPADGPVRATPPVRKYAKDRGVELAHVRVAGDDRTVRRSDVDAHLTGAATASAPAAKSRTERVAGLRKHTAAAMVKSAFEVPHAAVMHEVDVTETLELMRDMKAAGTKVSFLSLVARAVVRAARRTPSVNATFKADAGEIEYYDYVNLGIAVATPKGLVVASIDDAQEQSATELTANIAETAQQARDGQLTHEQLTSSTLTISNVGVFGVETGIPIINPGESAILALGAIRKKPWAVGDDIQLRSIVKLAVSFDHRLIDGAEASTFVRDIADVLERPGIALVD